LFNANLKKLGEGKIPGCHYHAGEISISDWDKNSKDEIIYRINAPMQSISFIQKVEEVYIFNQEHTFKRIFNIALETRSCYETNNNKGSLITNNYEYLHNGKILVNETEFSFNCDNFEWENEIKNTLKIRTKRYFMVWNYKTQEYVLETNL